MSLVSAVAADLDPAEIGFWVPQCLSGNEVKAAIDKGRVWLGKYQDTWLFGHSDHPAITALALWHRASSQTAPSNGQTAAAK